MKIKTIYRLLSLAICAVAFAFVTSCEGPAGPMGPAGANGTDGISGTDGTDGVDGNVSCLECHTQVGMDALNAMYVQSGHGNAGFELGYAGGRADCARCHSNEGFQYHVAGISIADFSNPTKISCSTCHSNHISLEDDISAPMVTEAAVTAMTDGTTLFDFNNVSNLCANCHQSRKNGDYYDKYTTNQTFDRKFTGDDIAVYQNGALGPAGTAVLAGDTLLVTFDVPTTHVYLSSTHAGPHYGTQTNNLFGVGGYGNSSTATHSTLGCVSCHMGTAGATAGGHSFYANVDNCLTCHADATDFDINGAQTAFDARMVTLGAALEAVKAIKVDPTTGDVEVFYGSITKAEFMAFWNFMILYEDQSHGVHNPSYFETLFTSAETNLGI